MLLRNIEEHLIHLNDELLLGGTEQTFIGLSAFAQTQHLRWGSPEDAIAARWSEDWAALSVLGADYLRLNHLDCIYRGKEHGHEPEWYYASEEAIFGPVHPSEQSLAADEDLHLRRDGLADVRAGLAEDLDLVALGVVPAAVGQAGPPSHVVGRSRGTAR